MRIQWNASAVSITGADVKRLAADCEEKLLVIERLNKDVGKYGETDDVQLDLSGSFFNMVKGSSIYNLHAPLAGRIEELQERAFIQDVINALAIETYSHAALTEEGELLIFSKGKLLPPLPLSATLDEDRKDVDLLAQCAAQTGGVIWDTNEGSLEQWLKFYEFDIPATVGDCKKLIEHLSLEEFDPWFGNYWGQISGEDELSAVLTDAEKSRIKAFTATLLTHDVRLLDKVYKGAASALAGANGDNGWLIEQMLFHEDTQLLAKKYIQALDWYGADDIGSMGSEELGQLMLSAIIIDLDSTEGSANRNVICGFDLYQPANCDLHPYAVFKAFENHLITTRKVSREAAALAAHIMLSDQAPEFLVQGISEDMLVGSVGWISFCSAVATLELKTKGLARVMDASKIQVFGNMEPPSKALRDLRAIAVIDPVLDWGLINGIITHDALAADLQSASNVVFGHYETHMKLLARTAEVLARPLPDKMTCALQELKRALPGCDFLEKDVLFERRVREAGEVPAPPFALDIPPVLDKVTKPDPKARSMVEIHASGELTSRQWDLMNQPSIFRQFGAPIYALAPIKPFVIKEVSRWYDNLKGAMTTTLKLAISRMPSADRRVFLNGDVSFFTLRPSVGIYHTPPVSTQNGLTGAASVSRTVLSETQQARDEATGRYGVVMCALKGGNEVLCYEVLTLQGVCRKNERLAELVRLCGAMNKASRLDYDGNLKAYVPAAAVLTLPTDLGCFTEGRRSASANDSRGVIDKLGTLRKINRSAEYNGTAYQSFDDVQLTALAAFIVDHHPPATYKDVESVALLPTPLEEERQRLEKLGEYVLNLVVPFRSCIADLTSGDKDRIGSGVFGCVMDAIGLLGTAVGVASKVMSVIARSVSTTAKVASLARFALSTTISVFNPLDGFGAMARTGGKLLGRGGARLVRNGVKTLTSARFQLRRIVGHAASVDLWQASDYARLCQGSWRPSATSAQVLNVRALKQGTHWFAINRSGRAWGPKLSHFTFAHALRPHQSFRRLPDAYTGHIIGRALPRASSKVDGALRALINNVDQLKTDLVAGLLFGSSARGRDNMLTYLKLIKTDFDGFSVGNCFLQAVQEDGRTMLVDSALYLAWKRAGMPASETHRFMKVYGENLQDHFHNAHMSPNVIADDLIHEVIKIDPKFRQLAIAPMKPAIEAEHYKLDVAPLINLARGHARVPTSIQADAGVDASRGSFKASSGEGASGKYDKSRALENADTYAVMTLLLDQASGEYNWRFRRNLETLQSAVTASNGEQIEGEILLAFDL